MLNEKVMELQKLVESKDLQLSQEKTGKAHLEQAVKV